jgi:uncharacterized membrane protein YuzA (DUF378 family)
LNLGNPQKPSSITFLTERNMKSLNMVTLFLLIVGGANWGLVGLFNVDLVAAIFGTGSAIARIVYVLVGLSALWQLMPLGKALRAS